MGINGRIVVVDDYRVGKPDNHRFLAYGITLSRWLRWDLHIIRWDDEVLLQKKIDAIQRGILVIGLSQTENKMGRIGAWKERLLENCQMPVLIMPPRYDLKRRGFESFFVPMSGETRSNAALDWAIRKGSELGVPVDIFHVTEELQKCGCDKSIVGHVSDEFYHEYPKLVEQFISQASPYTTGKQKRVIREFCHCVGDSLSLLLAQLPKRRRGLLVLEWKGHLEPGRARLVKHLIGLGRLPILLVKQAERNRSRLKVGEDFKAA